MPLPQAAAGSMAVCIATAPNILINQPVKSGSDQPTAYQMLTTPLTVFTPRRSMAPACEFCRSGCRTDPQPNTTPNAAIGNRR